MRFQAEHWWQDDARTAISLRVSRWEAIRFGLWLVVQGLTHRTVVSHYRIDALRRDEG